MKKEKIRTKVALMLPLTGRECATYILYIATSEELKQFLKEKGENGNDA